MTFEFIWSQECGGPEKEEASEEQNREDEVPEEQNREEEAPEQQNRK